jgi:two-component system, OmpR family, sensor histidine kinase KdpD
LRRIRADDERRRRAKLRIYLGYAPGVGKTFAMLSAARELHDGRAEVVVGVIETHGRFDTAALVLGLELLPRRTVDYRGRKLEEFDLDAALERKPKVLLVDELAHTNAAGARHAKRWQDVLDLLDAGIDVYTTLNIQHIESLNDVIAQITGVRVRETVPDSLLARADEIELIDLPPEELLVRLREGKVYLSEQAARAVDHFFRKGNLLALRELALRRAADRVDLDVLAHREEHEIETTWPTQERILVCVGPAPASARLVRAAARMAAGLRAPWVAAYVEHMGVAPITKGDRERLDAHLRLAESLGADVAHLGGTKISEALLDYSRKQNVTRIVIGKPTHSRIRDLLRGSLLDEVVRGSGDIDVHVISGDVAVDSAPSPPASPAEREHVDWRAYAWTLGLVAFASGVSAIGRSVLALPDIAMLFLLPIMLVASRFGRGPTLLAAFLSVASYDFLFIPPLYTFDVSDVRHALTFAVMFATGLVISGLTFRIRRQEQRARAREEQTAALYALSRELGAAPHEQEVARALARHAAEAFERPVAVLLPDVEGMPKVAARIGDIAYDSQEQAVARWVLMHAKPAGFGTDTLPGARLTCIPLGAGSTVLGVLALGAVSNENHQAEDPHFLDGYVRQAGIALERARLAEDAKAQALRARTEEMRSSLLSAVSHDLRTPLAVITGASTALLDTSASVTDAQRRELLETISEEAERLERLVRNLLDMTRVESGSLKVKREWMPFEEIVVSVLARLESKLRGRPVVTDVPADLPLISVDPILFEQVFVNLLENIAKYTPAGSPVEIRARVADEHVAIEVADRGPGIPSGSEESVFEKFFRGSNAGGGGVGLGLAICRGIIEAHGGSVRAANRSGGGATFEIELPILGTAPPFPMEKDPEVAA